jgi:hypothetical protein
VFGSKVGVLHPGSAKIAADASAVARKRRRFGFLFARGGDDDGLMTLLFRHGRDDGRRVAWDGTDASSHRPPGVECPGLQAAALTRTAPGPACARSSSRPANYAILEVNRSGAAAALDGTTSTTCTVARAKASVSVMISRNSPGSRAATFKDYGKKTKTTQKRDSSS